MKIYLVREHLNVGDEFILTAYTDEGMAGWHAECRRNETGTKNFDVVEIEEGEVRS